MISVVSIFVSSLSTTNINWGWVHLFPGVYFSGQRKHKPSARCFCSASGDNRVMGTDGLEMGGKGNIPVDVGLGVEGVASVADEDGVV